MPSLNTWPAQAAARQPRAIVQVNGLAMPGWVSWEVNNNTYYQADTFRVSFAVSRLPAATGADWFSRQTEAFVEIFAGFPADPDASTLAELESLIYGRVDDIDFDPVRAEIMLTGRDLTAAFIDAKTAGQWQNQKSSDVAIALATSHGLDATHVSATTRKIGAFYAYDNVRMTMDRSEWDVLSWLANEEGFVCYVKGRALHFEPDPRGGSSPYLIRWDAPTNERGHPIANVSEVSFSRALTVAKGVNVTVRSQNVKTGKPPVTASYPAKSKGIQAGKASPFGSVQNYLFTVHKPLTQDAAMQLAIKHYKEIIAHEMKLSARLPADNLLSTLNLIQVEGTGTAFDQTYYPNSITRMMSIDEGYTMTIGAKNHNPDTVPAL